MKIFLSHKKINFYYTNILDKHIIQTFFHSYISKKSWSILVISHLYYITSIFHCQIFFIYKSRKRSKTKLSFLHFPLDCFFFPPCISTFLWQEVYVSYFNLDTDIHPRLPSHSAPYNFCSSVGGRCEPSEQLPKTARRRFQCRATAPSNARNQPSEEAGESKVLSAIGCWPSCKIKKWKIEEKKRTWSHVIKFRVAWVLRLGMFLHYFRCWGSEESATHVFWFLPERYRFLRRPIPVVPPLEKNLTIFFCRI